MIVTDCGLISIYWKYYKRQDLNNSTIDYLTITFCKNLRNENVLKYSNDIYKL